MTDITVVGAGGEYMESVVVVAWHKQPGEAVAAGDLVVTVETAKAATDIEAPASGVLDQIRAKIGEEVAVGSVLGVIREAGAPTPAETIAPSAAVRPPVPASVAPEPLLKATAPATKDRLKASPLARRVAVSEGVDLSVLTASSPSGRIKLRDVEAFVRRRPSHAALPAATAAAGELSLTRRGGRHGTPFVFLHGFGADSFSWQPLIAALGPDVAAVLVDLPGHGRSSAVAGPVSVEALAAAVAAALATAGIEECHLVGHSLGGAVAIALAETGRLALRSLTLIAPAGLGPEIDGDFLAGYGRARRAESLRPWLLRLFADAAIVTPGYVAAALAARTDALRATQADLVEAVFPDGTQATELRPALRRVAAPQKIIWGERDRIIPMRHALNAGAEAALHFLPEIGHMPHVEAPAVVARLVLQNARSAG
ncbi:acetoin dehydrogenase dihydrolipoyllysine-residue acetyltransferase subunit [Ancylobacter sp. Lp-2]|uniref:acetoin dehydrogenase dihydrolipoyllysine-residue acetyltransferase subunit n=1 Tax=Ancylobacter sp. Lp-2 TaxID=2881339 RepID=UPI001E5AD67C|nr:acetoin dehydrogenase dihydrolipoyllysine-residue acetyltransferase subunit [Ancylobacter sp. Lp-2]